MNPTCHAHVSLHAVAPQQAYTNPSTCLLDPTHDPHCRAGACDRCTESSPQTLWLSRQQSLFPDCSCSREEVCASHTQCRHKHLRNASVDMADGCHTNQKHCRHTAGVRGVCDSAGPNDHCGLARVKVTGTVTLILFLVLLDHQPTTTLCRPCGSEQVNSNNALQMVTRTHAEAQGRWRPEGLLWAAEGAAYTCDWPAWPP
jgi:hypothetical protein